MRRTILTICSFVIAIVIAVLCTCRILGVWSPSYQEILNKIMATAGIVAAPFGVTLFVVFLSYLE